MEQKNKTEEFKSSIEGVAVMDYLNRQQISTHNTAIDILSEMKKECTTFGELATKVETFNQKLGNDSFAGKYRHEAIQEALYDVLRNEPLTLPKESPLTLNEESESLDIESILEEMIIEFREKMKDCSLRMNFTISKEIRDLIECLTSVRKHNSIICIHPQILEE